MRTAFEMAAEAHQTMRRKSGEPYILHPLAVAQICVEEIGLGVRSTICALLHDTVEDTDVTLEDVAREFGNEIARIIDGLTKISTVVDANSSPGTGATITVGGETSSSGGIATYIFKKLLEDKIVENLFIVKEVKPYIDKTFPVYTTANHTAIMGSSMGGLISWYALSEYPQVFGGAACLSTHWPGSFEPEDNPVPAAFFDYLRQKLPEPGRHKLYFDFGTATLDAWYPPLQAQADAIMASKGYDSSNWQTLRFDGAEHSENAWAERLHLPLTFLLGNAPATIAKP